VNVAPRSRAPAAPIADSHLIVTRKNTHLQARDPLFDLTGRVAVVTGASSGLRERFARVLRERGAQLVLAGRRADRLSALATQLGQDHAEAVVTDVADEEAMRTLLNRAVMRFGHLDITLAASRQPIKTADRVTLEHVQSRRATLSQQALHPRCQPLVAPALPRAPDLVTFSLASFIYGNGVGLPSV
jgi:hypothetical protein